MRCGEVGSRVPGLEVGRGAGAVEEQRDEQQRGAAERGRDDDTGTAEGAGEISGGQSGAAAEAPGDASDDDGGDGGARGEQPGGASALALANSAVALPGGHTADLLGTPARAEQWLVRRDLAPTGAGLAEVCATQLRSLREQVRSLLASRVADQPALPAAVTAITTR